MPDATENADAPPDDGFEEAARPLIRWIAENLDPHHKVIATARTAEIVRGKRLFQTEDYLLD